MSWKLFAVTEQVDRARIVLLVDLDEPDVQPLHGERVLVLQVVEALRLQAEELVQLVEPPLPELEIGLERRETARDVADATLQRVDLPRERTDLRVERGGAALGRGDLALQGAELRVDARLLAAEAVARPVPARPGSGREQAEA